MFLPDGVPLLGERGTNAAKMAGFGTERVAAAGDGDGVANTGVNRGGTAFTTSTVAGGFSPNGDPSLLAGMIDDGLESTAAASTFERVLLAADLAIGISVSSTPTGRVPSAISFDPTMARAQVVAAAAYLTVFTGATARVFPGDFGKSTLIDLRKTASVAVTTAACVVDTLTLCTGTTTVVYAFSPVVGAANDTHSSGRTAATSDVSLEFSPAAEMAFFGAVTASRLTSASEPGFLATADGKTLAAGGCGTADLFDSRRREAGLAICDAAVDNSSRLVSECENIPLLVAMYPRWSPFFAASCCRW